MTNKKTTEIQSYGDALSAPFWKAAAERRLILQHCNKCDHFQFYPRPFCLECQSDDVSWIDARGTGTIYSKTTVQIQISPEFKPPYTVMLVELDEGPRVLGHVSNGDPEIGERVEIDWTERDSRPPLPIFRIFDSD